MWQSALAGVHYVDVNSTNATPPYTNWITAATNIQDAVDAAVAGDEIVVTNGTYATGWRTMDGATMDRVEVDKLLSLRSVNGPQYTTIDGGQCGRCVYLSYGASLTGFTLTSGRVYYYSGGGAGAYGGTLNNCTLWGNSVSIDSPIGSYYYGANGGGATDCTLNNCTLTDNSVTITIPFQSDFVEAEAQGGGAYFCTLNNCTLTGNSASIVADRQSVGRTVVSGGGAYFCTLNNCTLTGNSTLFGGPGGAADCTLNNCINFGNYENFTCEDCSSPGYLDGNKNWYGDPVFVDLVSGNLRLQSNSPCINAGNNSYVTTATDLDGNPRISGGTVDIGAYEFQFNHAPLALANVSPLFAIPQGGTNRFILSPNNADATIVLDGSQSSDADNDPLQFFWYADGQTNALASGALATNQFAVGPHTVRLVVSDGHDTATAQVSFEVITPATAVGQLMAAVDEASLGSRNQQPLLATLSAAKSAFVRGNFQAGVDQLSAFQNQIRAQVAPWNPALAGELITATQRISEVVGGG